MDHLGNIKRYLVVICSNLRSISTMPSDLQRFATEDEKFLAKNSAFGTKSRESYSTSTLRRSYSDIFIKSMAREKEFAVTPRKRLQYQNNLFISRQSPSFEWNFYHVNQIKVLLFEFAAFASLKCSSRI